MTRLLLLAVALSLSSCQLNCLSDLLRKEYGIDKAEFSVSERAEGTRVDFDLRVVGVSTQKAGDGYEVEVLIEMKVVAPDGTPLQLPPETTNNFKTTSKDRVDFVAFTPYLDFPKNRPAGVYAVSFDITDQVAKKKASKTLEVSLP